MEKKDVAVKETLFENVIQFSNPSVAQKSYNKAQRFMMLLTPYTVLSKVFIFLCVICT